jgi:CheY-like chemotaxis protein/signal transduction histidine kinase/CHASE3 domain sensor protein
MGTHSLDFPRRLFLSRLMPRRSSALQQRRFPIPLPVLAGFLAAAVASLIIAAVNVRSSTVRAEAVDGIDRMTTAMRQLNEFSLSLKDAETGQRGFLLTGDEAYLHPYRRATDVVEMHLQGLAVSNARSPERQQLVSQIDSLSHQKLHELQETIDLRRAGKLEDAMTVVRTDRGKNTMDRLNGLVSDLYRLQNRELDRRRQAWVEAASTSTLYSWSGSLILLLLVLISAGLTMREYRRKARQTWVAAGLSGLGQSLQGDHRLEDIGQQAMAFLARYLRAQVGVGYALDGKEPGYKLFGSYALPRERAEAPLMDGEGLAGQVVRSRQLMRVDDLPAGHLDIQSSTGQSRPAELLIAPAIENGKVYAVIELGFLRRTGDAEADLLREASSMLAIAVRSAMDRSRLENLLEETRRQSEELLVQQEEMRVNNEELEQQSQVLQRSQTQLEQQQRELEQTNAHLEEQTQKLEHQREQLLRAQDALTHKARELEMASQYKSEFLANMSHELRTPLNSTLILAKLLSDNKAGNLTAEQIKYAQTIHAAGTDLLALINDILDLAKIEAGQATVVVESINVAGTMKSLLEPLRPLAEQKGLSLSLHIDPQVPARMSTDPLRLGQILKNLLSNAIKFTHRGGVDLRISSPARDTMTFVVRDTGIGIPEHQQQLIFEAFHQADGSTHRKYGGTGLGLSIARNLSGLLGGTLSVQSTPGQGSSFTLALPTVQAEGDAAGASWIGASPVAPLPAPPAEPIGVPASAPAPCGERHILVVEDDARFAAIMVELAEEMNFSCQVAGNAADGLAAAVQCQPKAIVLDINLPDFSGLGVLDQLKRNPATRHIPVHIVSVADYSQEAMGRGAIGYALKPVKREELVDALCLLEAKFTQDMRRVLVVEDDERQRDSVRSLLGSSDVEVVCADTAEAALARLRQGTYDCMIMDLNLPDMNGYELLQQMTDQDGVSFPPVIVYTGRTLSRDEEMRLRRFSNSIIIKDARSPERLLDEVTLFLHQVESRLSPEHRQMLQQARNRETALEGRTVLVVEDDVRNVFALTSILEPTGIHVEIARNGREALDVLARENMAVDLVLMDIMMPEMDGYTAMREIRNLPKWRRLPIIALTAKAMKDDQEKCLAAGANDYIAKPLDVEKLLSLVRVWMPK